VAGQGRYREALPLYGRVLARQPAFAEAHNNIAIAYAQTGNLDQALIHFREAIRIRPDYRAAIKNLEIAEKEKKRSRDKGSIRNP
jgi:protein O-GlcNAc transferase